MGNNCCQCIKDKPLEESPFNNNDNNKEEYNIKEKVSENQYNHLQTEEVINYIPSSPTERRINTNEETQKNSKINLQKNSLFSLNKLSEDRPDIMDAYIKTDYNKNYDNLLLSESQSEESNNNNIFSVGLLKMEKNLFNLINDLRNNPKSFIPKIEKYKNRLQKNKDFYFLTLEENTFTFQKGIETFDECINFLKDQKSLSQFENSPSMFESKMLFKDKNISDLNFVLMYNLMDIKSPDNNKIRRNCIMSEIYKKLNITITKDDFLNNLYTFYFSFDQ